MRKLLFLCLLIGSISAEHSQAFSADDLATREGEIVFGQAWLKSTRSRLGERIDPFVLTCSRPGLLDSKTNLTLAQCR